MAQLEDVLLEKEVEMATGTTMATTTTMQQETRQRTTNIIDLSLCEACTKRKMDKTLLYWVH